MSLEDLGPSGQLYEHPAITIVGGFLCSGCWPCKCLTWETQLHLLKPYDFVEFSKSGPCSFDALGINAR